MNNKDKVTFFAHLAVSAVGIALFVFVFMKYLFVPLLPFVIAWGSAFVIRPAAVFVSRRLRIPRKAVSVALAVIGVSAVLVAAVGIIWYGLSEVFQFFSRLAEEEKLFEILSVLANPIGAVIGNGEGAEELEEYLGDTVNSAITQVMNWLVGILTGIVKSIPSVAFFILITVIASVYFALDIDRINQAVRSLLPPRVANFLIGMKNSFFDIRVAATYPISLPHVSVDGKLAVRHDLQENAVRYAAGGLFSGADDLCRLARLILNDGVADSGDRIISADMVDLMRTAHSAEGYGLTMRSFEGGDRFLYGHLGSAPPYATSLMTDKISGYGVITLINTEENDLRTKIPQKIFEFLY